MSTADHGSESGVAGTRKSLRVRRILRWLLVLAVVLAGGVLVGWAMVRSQPGWYRFEQDAEQVNQSANRFEDRLVELVNWAAAVGAAELRAGRPQRTGSAIAGPDREWELRLRADELTAFVRRWAVVNGWDREIGRYWRDAVVAITDGKIIVGGKPGAEAPGVSSAGESVLGLHLRPGFNERTGELSLVLERVTVGRLPLPGGWFAGPMRQAADRVRTERDRWNRDARLDERGRANTAMTRASAARVLEGLLRQQATEAGGFVPMDERRGLAVRVLGVRTEEGELVVRLGVVPLDERGALGDRVRERSR